MFRFSVFILNSMWLIASLPAFFLFLMSGRFYSWKSKRKVLKLVKLNQNSAFGREHNFSDISCFWDFLKLPITEYEDYLKYIDALKRGEQSVLTEEPVLLLEPTGGSSSTKLIPYTKSLKREFNNAIGCWVADMFIRNPGLLFGKQYWSISPNTAIDQESSAVKIGFEDDAQYLSGIKGLLASKVWVVPPMLAQVKDRTAFRYLSQLFLLKEKNLRFISIWHPSFIISLLDDLDENWEHLVDDIGSGQLSVKLKISKDLIRKVETLLNSNRKRAGELRSLTSKDLAKVWPKLQMISCWYVKGQGRYYERLNSMFPKSKVVPKGLMSTEGITSFPFGRGNQLITAVNSHYYEFKACDSQKVFQLNELKTGKRYTLLLTTSGGLYRYNTHDLVKVVGRKLSIPCLEFISRDNMTSDLVGEKVSQLQAESIISQLPQESGFTLITSNHHAEKPYYILVSETKSPDKLKDWFEEKLCENYHYKHARELNQLGHAQIRGIEENSGLQTYMNHQLKNGRKEGDVKIPSLLLCCLPEWLPTESI